MKGETIEKIVENGLCTGCGTCVAMCPASAINLTSLKEGVYKPEIQKQLCNLCGICTAVCPGRDLDFTKLKQIAFKDMDIKRGEDDPLVGRYLACYVGHASKTEIRQRSASGGLVTALLILALEENIIDGALVTRMSSTNPLAPESLIARTVSEILSASRSKYCPVAANVALKEILEKDGRYAVVGLPCHLHGLRKAEAINDKLRQRVIFHFGIFCSHTVSFKGTEFLFRRLGIKSESDIASIAYRDRGWPGGFLVRLRDGNEKFIPLNSYWAPFFGRFFFTPRRCTLCPDGLAELADISFGDAWLPEFRRERDGESILLIRTKEGEELVDLAIKRGDVELIEVEAKKVLQSQRDQILFKKKNLPARTALVRLLGNEVPHFEGIRFLKPDLWDRITAPIPYLNIKISGTRLGCAVLLKAPIFFLHAYGLFIQNLYNRSYGEYLSIQAEPVAPLPPKIVIINSYSPNIGDLSIVTSMVNTLQATFPKAELTVFATDPQLTAEHLSGIVVHQSLGSRSGRWWRQAINFLMFLRNWFWVYFRQKRVNLFFLMRRKTRRALYEYLDADVIVSCGGGYLNDNAGCAFLGCLFDIFLGCLIGKPVMLYAQSIGPFRNKHLKRIAKIVLNSVDLITLRDEVSVEFLKQLEVKSPKIMVTADAALLLPEAATPRTEEILTKAGINTRLPLVTVTVKPWHFPGTKNPRQQKQKYLASLTALCAHIICQYGARILFIPMDVRDDSNESKKGFVGNLVKMTKELAKKVLGRATEPVFRGETDLIQKILHNLNDYDRVFVLNGQYTPSEIKAIIGRSTVHIATRMHSSIYAASLGIPILGIAYEPKMVSFMKRLGQNRFVLDIESVEPERLITMFNDLWEEKEQVSRIIQQKAEELRKLASSNAELLRELLSEVVEQPSK